MTVTLDVITSEVESGYIVNPFDTAKVELEIKGYELISLEKFARLRISQGIGSNISRYGAFVKEGFLHVPQKGIYLVKNSPIIASAKKATECHRRNTDYYLTPEQIEKALENSVKFSDRYETPTAIPTNRFGEDERTVFTFGQTAENYGNFLANEGISRLFPELTGIDEKSFVRQVWFSGIDELTLKEDRKNLHEKIIVRGVRNVNSKLKELSFEI